MYFSIGKTKNIQLAFIMAKNNWLFSLVVTVLISISCTNAQYKEAERLPTYQKTESQPTQYWQVQSKHEGLFEMYRHQSDIVLAAPHGTTDKLTDAVVRKLSQKLQWNSIIATGFRSKEKPYNVNRPTEGVGLKPAQEVHSIGAGEVYKEYLENMLSLLSGMPRLYIEIHGQNSTPKIEIAHVGLNNDQIVFIKNEFETQKMNFPNLQTFEVVIEGIDKIKYGAGGVTRYGILSKTPHAVHIELPRKTRIQFTDETIEFLAVTLKNIEHIVTKHN